MASINFFAGKNTPEYNLNGSGLGFYSSDGFGYAVQVGSYQGKTYITNSAGTIQGPEADNIQYNHPSSGYANGSATSSGLLQIPNYAATLNVRLTNDSAVTTQNGRLYIYDRTSISNSQSGVTCQVAELRHPWSGTSPNGSGSSTWTSAAGSSSYLAVTNSPGSGGEVIGSNTQHDWYFAVSASPASIGAKTQFGLYFACEYL